MRLTRFTRGLLAALLGLTLAFAGLHLLTRGPDVVPFWWRFLDMRDEYTLPTMVNSAQLLLAGGVAVVNAWLTTRRLAGRLYWLGLAALFLFLGLDEYLSIHDTLGDAFLVSGQIIVYFAAGVVVTLVVVGAWRFGLRDEAEPVLPFLLGLALMGGSLVVDYVAQSVWEEVLEESGAALVLVAFLARAEMRLGGTLWARTRRWVAGGAVLVMAVFVAGVWLVPSLENWLIAERVNVEYADGGLTLVGYRVMPEVLAPGEEATVRLYWRAERRLPTYYYLSAHLVSPPEFDSYGQDDFRMGGWRGWQTHTWLPGVVMRDVARVRLAEDAPTPRSYWLVLRPFSFDGPQYAVDPALTVDVPLGASDRERFGENEVVLVRLPAVPDAMPPEPPAPSDFRFAEGFSLVGYALPAEAEVGGRLPLAFWWRTEADVESDLTQFVHLVDAEGVDVMSFDQQPFGGAFPTSDWPAGMAVRDEWEVPIAADLPPGEYLVEVGLYALASGARQPVTDGEGAPVEGFAVRLGTVRLR